MSEKITIDTREKTTTVLTFKKHFPDIKVETLKTGDIQLYQPVADSYRILERKTVADFVSSICDGRFFDGEDNQLSRLSELGCGGIVVIGDYKSEVAKIQRMFNNKHLFSRISGVVSSICLRYWLPIFYFENDNDFALWIENDLMPRMDIKLRKKKLPKPNKRDTRENPMALYLPPKIIKALLDEFGSVSKIINADNEDLIKIKGVGKKTLESIENFKKDLK